MGRNTFLRASLAPLILAAALVIAGLAPWGVDEARAIAAPYAPGEVVVRLAPADGATIAAVNAAYGTATIRELRVTSGTYLLSTPPGEEVATTIMRMRGDSRLAFVEPNYLSGAPEARPRKVRVWGGPDEAPRHAQYALSQLRIADAHATTQGQGVTVAVIDTGVQLDHPALAASLLPDGYDFVDGDTVPEDVADGLDNDGDGLVDEAFGHGTHVAGIVLLVAPQAKILPIRALDDEGNGEVYAVAMAIEYAVAHGADVINLSLGTDLQTELLRDVVQAATLAGVLVVAAAGNSVDGIPEYPAADPCAVGVTATQEDSSLAPDAALDAWVDLAAPGESIYSALIPGGYGWWSGTSMAAPFVSGQAALLLAVRPDLGLRQLTALSVTTAQSFEVAHGTGTLSVHTINVGASVDLAATGFYFSGRKSFIPTECVASPAVAPVDQAGTTP